MVEKTLATFKIEPTQWEKFKARCAELDSNATKTILSLIDGFLDGKISLAPNPQDDINLIDERLDKRIDARLDERIDLAIAPLKAELQALYLKIANQPQYPQNLPSENALEGAPSKALVRSDVKQKQPATGKTAPENYGVLPPTADKGLSQTALCDFYGLNWRNLKRNLAIAGFDTVEGYFQQMTGIAWTQGKTAGMTKRYFPDN